jgi:hypothetical protein
MCPHFQAGIVTGLIARLRGLSKADRQPLLNDAMLFLQALENGCCLLTRDIGGYGSDPADRAGGAGAILPAGRVRAWPESRAS